MKIIDEPKEKTAEDLHTEKYEFRACGGSIEPEDVKKDDRKDENTEE